MHELLATVAHWLNAILPDAFQLPSLTFVLPHSVYWLGLILFPFLAMYMVRRSEQRGPPKSAEARVNPAVAWMLWVGGGFVGLHRFYLRSALVGFVYAALTLGVLVGSNNARVSRVALSDAANQIEIGQFDSDYYAGQVEEGVEGAAERLAEAQAVLDTARVEFAVADEVHGVWRKFAGTLALIIFVMLIYDAIRMGALIRRARAIEATLPPPREALVVERHGHTSPRRLLQTPFTRAIGAINGFAGRYVAYWSVLAVAAYYFEVVARYIFNSPTNWVHESMFLMFGMQYLLSGGYVLREDSHVRVDVIYERFSERTKAIIDLVTSISFFIFTVTLLVTGWIFAADSIGVWEVSFTEWGIQYWPVKLAIPIGAALIVLQGITMVIQDVLFLMQRKA
jgi:TRAP-type mannitol/chloroaromatic compound transport system permease small subunit